jgi:hypothetical protein
MRRGYSGENEQGTTVRIFVLLFAVLISQVARADLFTAIDQAKRLKWDLAPLNERLARYESGQAWYGNLLIL